MIKKLDSSITAVIVDDDIDTRESFGDFLTDRNVKVLALGKNGKEAGELFEKHRPDIVLMDIMMPDYDGFYGLKKIRSIDPNAKVIVITADLQRETEQKLRDLNVSSIIYKPHDENDLVQTIESVAKETVEVSSVTPSN